MSNFTIEKGPLDGLMIIHIEESTNHNAYQTYDKHLLQQLGFDINFVQDN